jgi:hypothetical protein
MSSSKTVHTVSKHEVSAQMMLAHCGAKMSRLLAGQEARPYAGQQAQTGSCSTAYSTARGINLWLQGTALLFRKVAAMLNVREHLMMCSHHVHRVSQMAVLLQQSMPSSHLWLPYCSPHRKQTYASGLIANADMTLLFSGQCKQRSVHLFGAELAALSLSRSSEPGSIVQV